MNCPNNAEWTGRPKYKRFTLVFVIFKTFLEKKFPIILADYIGVVGVGS